MAWRIWYAKRGAHHRGGPAVAETWFHLSSSKLALQDLCNVTHHANIAPLHARTRC